MGTGGRAVEGGQGMWAWGICSCHSARARSRVNEGNYDCIMACPPAKGLVHCPIWRRGGLLRLPSFFLCLCGVWDALLSHSGHAMSIAQLM